MTETPPADHDRSARRSDDPGRDVEQLLTQGGRPDAAPIARVRKTVMARYGDALAAGAFVPPQHQAARARRFVARVSVTRGVALAVVALFGVTHDRPGEPFYPVRIAVEEFTLPSGAARWPAQLQV